MSTSQAAPKPIFQYNFEVVNNQLKDLSGNGLDITVPAHDFDPEKNPVSGYCLKFAGTTDGLNIVNNLSKIVLTKGFTFTAWVNLPPGVDRETYFLSILGNSGQPSVDFMINTKKLLPIYKRSDPNEEYFTSNNKLTANSWQYVAIAVDTDGTVTIWVNDLAPEQYTHQNIFPGADYNTTVAAIGYSYFEGNVAWMSLYDGPLDSAGIEADKLIRKKYLIASLFRQSYAIDFKLYSDDNGAENPIMFIKDAGEGEDLNLRITNKSKSKLTIKPEAGPASLKDYHFQLRFRPGTLTEDFVSANNPQLIMEPDAWQGSPTAADWSVVVAKDPKSGVDALSFLFTGKSSNLAKISLAKGAQGRIVVKAVNASATQGSRNTNVELRYRELYAGSGDGTISGYRSQNVSIVNHSGEKEIPLRAEIIGNASVMTYAKPADGSTVNNPPTTELIFRIVNTGLKPLPLALPDAEKKGGTIFTLGIDVQPENHLIEWALVDAGVLDDKSVVLNKLGVLRKSQGTSLVLEGPLMEDLAAGTSLKISGLSDPFTVASPGALAGDYKIPLKSIPTAVEKGAEIQLADNDAAWTVTFVQKDLPPNKQQWKIKNQTKKALAPGAGLSFILKGIECSLSSGNSVITINYDDVPGHWPGTFELPVIKSPIALSQNLVGINTHDPLASLHITERNDYDPLRIGKVNTSNGVPGYKTVSRSIGQLLFSLDANVYYYTEGDDTLKLGLSFWRRHSSGWKQEFYQLPTSEVPPSVDLNDFLNKGAANKVAGKVVQFDTYYHVWLNDKLEILTYHWKTSVEHELEFADVVSSFSGNKTGTFTKNNFMVYNGSYFICLAQLEDSSHLSITSFIENSLVNADMSYVDHIDLDTSDASKVSNLSASAEYLMVSKKGPDGLKFDFVKIKSSGALIHIAETKKHIPDVQDQCLKGEMAFILTKTQVQCYENLSAYHHGPDNKITPTKTIDLPSKIASFQSLAVSNDLLAVLGTSVDNQKAAVCFYVLPRFQSPRYILHTELSLSSELSIGLSKDSFFISDASKPETYFYDLQDIIGTKSTIIRPDSLTIDAVSSELNSYLKLPYPTGALQKGVQVGESITSESAGLSISVNEESEVAPVIINDYNSAPIFNIKKSSVGYAYNVGIGSEDPESLLEITLPPLAEVDALSILGRTGEVLFKVKQEGSLAVGDTGSEVFVVDSNGYVGIGTGTDTLGACFTIDKGTYDDKRVDIVGQQADFVIDANGYVGLGTKSPGAPLEVFVPGMNIPSLTVDSNGNVGIGDSSPSAPLVIGANCLFSSNFLSGDPNGYTFDLDGATQKNTGPLSNSHTSVFANGSIFAVGFIALSDVRVKDHSTLSDNNLNLATLLKLNVTDYQYIDFIGKGTGPKIGLIAQQVKEVFPQAVSDQNTDFIPNIYALATDLNWDNARMQLTVLLENDHEVEVGDKVRMVVENGFEEREVIAVPNHKTFVVADWEKPVDKLFVFGKEVYDLHTVDYDQVAMLGVSAIQALHAEVETLKKENEALKAQMASEMSALRKEWAAFKSSLTNQYQN